MLKLNDGYASGAMTIPAAFGRLCVETETKISLDCGSVDQPPSGGCVLKLMLNERCIKNEWPAAFGRLCVETININAVDVSAITSRLRAAVC